MNEPQKDAWACMLLGLMFVATLLGGLGVLRLTGDEGDGRHGVGACAVSGGGMHGVTGTRPDTREDAPHTEQRASPAFGCCQFMLGGSVADKETR